MMEKNFAIDLNNCPKTDRKAAIKLAKKNGFKWLDNDRWRDQNNNDNSYWILIVFDEDKDGLNMCYSDCHESVHETLQLPRDWDRFKELIGVGPKAGEIWTCDFPLIIRMKNPPMIGIENECYSKINREGEFNTRPYGHHDIDIFKLRKATPEEAAKLEAAERENGCYWDGKELAKKDPVSQIDWMKECEAWQAKYEELKSKLAELANK